MSEPEFELHAWAIMTAPGLTLGQRAARLADLIRSVSDNGGPPARRRLEILRRIRDEIQHDTANAGPKADHAKETGRETAT